VPGGTTVWRAGVGQASHAGKHAEAMLVRAAPRWRTLHRSARRPAGGSARAIVYERCCGRDGPKQRGVAWRMIPDAAGHRQQAGRTFRSMTAHLLELAEWWPAAGGTPVAMESTGVSGQPISPLLDGPVEVRGVNAPPGKAVRGRQTAGRAAEGLAALRRPGRVPGRFLPSAAQRVWRERTGHRRRLVQERARSRQRRQKGRADANSKRAGGASAVLGVWGRARREARLAGPTAPVRRAEWARGRRREQRPPREAALTGRLHAQQRGRLRAHREPSDSLDAAMARLRTAIVHQLSAEEAAVARWDTMPGGSQRVAEIRVAEVGSAPGRHFPRAKQRASWAGRCPGHHPRAGKRRSGQPRTGRRWRPHAWPAAAPAAARRKNTSLNAQDHRRAARRGNRRAVVALAHTILVSAYHRLTRTETYRDLGAADFDDLARTFVERRLVRRLERLGYQVELRAGPHIA
jgi:transposase